MKIAPMRYILVFLALTGCDGGADTGVATDTAVRAGCETLCERDQECLGIDSSGCADACFERTAGWVRADTWDDSTACLARVACEEYQGGCANRAEALPMHDAWVAACESFLSRCERGVNVCNVENRGTNSSIRWIAEPIMFELLECVEDCACDQQFACLETVVSRHGIPPLY